MISSAIKDELDQILPAAQSVGLKIETDVPLSYCQSLLRSHCIAVFFAIVDAQQGLQSSYELAEQEVARLIQEKGPRYFPRDKHLVLIVPPEVSWDLPEVEKIKADAHICRKLVCLVNAEPLSKQLENLPFWPAQILEVPAERLPGFDVLRALTTEGFDELLLQDVYRHIPGVESMIQNILSDKYRVDVSTRMSGSPDLSNLEYIHPSRTVSKAVSDQSRQLRRVEINNFRGIRSLTMDLSGKIILVYGANGAGKTSLIDALEWVMTGRIDRLTHSWPDDDKQQPDPVVNLFSDTDHAAVTLTLSIDHQVRRVIRHGTLLRSKQRLIDNRHIRDDRDIIDEIVGTSAPDEERKLRSEQLRELLRTSHFLGQSTMREFLERTNPKDRFDSLSKMLGAEAFVFFRRKVDQIAERLSSYSKTDRVEAEEAARVIEARQANLDKEEKALAAVSTALGESESTLDRAIEIRNRLAIQGFPLSDEQIRIASGSLLGGEVEASSILASEQVQTGISQLKKRLSQLQLTLENFRQQHQLDSLAALATDEIGKITGEMGELTKQRDLLEHEVGDCKRSLEQQTDLLAQTRRELGQNQWLLRNLPLWERLVRNHKDLAEKTAQLTGTRDSKEEEYRKLQSEVKTLQDQSEKLNQIRSEIDQKSQMIKALLTRLPQVHFDLNRLDVIGQTVLSSNEELTDSNNKLQILQRQKEDKSNALAAVRRRLSLLEQSMTRKAALLEELRQYIDSSVCPLCGHDHGSTDGLLSQVNSKMGLVFPDIAQLQESRESIDREIVNLDMQIQTLSSKIGQLRSQLVALGEEQNTLNSEIQTFRQNVMSIGIYWPDVPKRGIDQIESTLFDLGKSLSSRDVEQQEHDINTQLLVCKRQMAECKEELDDIRSMVEANKKQVSNLQKQLEDLEQEGRRQSIFLRESLREDEIQKLFQEKNQVADARAEDIANLERRVSTLETQISALNSQAMLKTRTTADHKASVGLAQNARDDLKNNLARLGFISKVTENDLDREIHRAEDAIRELDEIMNDVERLKAILQMENSRKRIDILRKELQDTREEACRKEAIADKKDEWVNCLTRLRSAVQKRHADSLEYRLHALEPVINLLYNRLSTHPLLTNVNLQVADKDSDQTVKYSLQPINSVLITSKSYRENCLSPGKFLNEAQINVLALSIFLAGAIQQRWSNLRTICIDDPVQQMDDMNTYAFLELIRGLARDRNFIITTCDPRFYQLAREMFECLNNIGQVGFRAFRLIYDGKEKHALIMDSPGEPEKNGSKSPPG